MSERVFEVTEVTLGVTGVRSIRIDAQGNASSAGWTNPALVRSESGGERAPNVFHFDFVADPPQGMSAQVLTPISASEGMSVPTGQRIRIVVHAASNEESAEIELSDDPI
ncbi:MAG TPA: hypothetical protein VJT09_06140 [Pyrinomonadaceae bacterium]|nr:hypothetical protein [Pyrinomonadaceae bacterium]